VAYVVPDWKVFLQIFSCLHLVTPISLYFLSESPRWLISTGKESKIKEAKGILEEAAKKNGMPKVVTDDLHLNLSPQQRENFLIVFKTPILLKRTLIMWFNWFVVSFIIYGLNLNWQALTGSIFLNFVVFSALDFPAKMLGLFIVMKGGRRMPFVLFVLASGTMLLLILAFEKGKYYKNWPIAMLGIAGSVSISVAFSIMWIYTTELYPTGVRFVQNHA
jgi:OCT family organic cation transporter-like MFS transporter 4/5